MPTLIETWAGLDRCAELHNPRELERHRRAAARHLNAAVDRAVRRVGLGPVYELVGEVDFRGWRRPPFA